MTQRSGAGSRGAAWRSGSASSRMMAVSVSAAESRSKAFRPAASSYRIVPSENWSERKSTGRPAACSGDM